MPCSLCQAGKETTTVGLVKYQWMIGEAAKGSRDEGWERKSKGKTEEMWHMQRKVAGWRVGVSRVVSSTSHGRWLGGPSLTAGQASGLWGGVRGRQWWVAWLLQKGAVPCDWFQNLCPLTDVLFPAWDSENGKNTMRVKGMYFLFILFTQHPWASWDLQCAFSQTQETSAVCCLLLACISWWHLVSHP